MANMFSIERYLKVVEFLKMLPNNISILDVGCGTGNVLEYIREETKVENISGLDIDEEALRIAKERGINVYRCSIVEDCLEKINEKFDVVIVGAVLHHVVSNSRKASIELAKRALLNSINFVKGGGYLIIVEPTYEPFWLLTLIFYIKKFFSLFTKQRITIFNYWNNIGPPVVSYFSNDLLLQTVKSFPNLDVENIYFEKKKMNFPQNLLFKRHDVTIICKKIIDKTDRRLS